MPGTSAYGCLFRPFGRPFVEDQPRPRPGFRQHELSLLKQGFNHVRAEDMAEHTSRCTLAVLSGPCESVRNVCADKSDSLIFLNILT